VSNYKEIWRALNPKLLVQGIPRKIKPSTTCAVDFMEKLNPKLPALGIL
jgi:hypothetical protein